MQKSSQHNCLKESIESFAYVEGGSAHSEQVTITLCFVEQAKANYSHDKEKKKKAVSPFFCLNFIFTNPHALTLARCLGSSTRTLLELEG